MMSSRIRSDVISRERRKAACFDGRTGGAGMYAALTWPPLKKKRFYLMIYDPSLTRP